MFYSNEINLQNLNTVPEMVQAMQSANIDRYFEVVELMATPRELIYTKKELQEFSETSFITIEGIEIEVISFLEYQRYSNGSAKLVQGVRVPMQNFVIRRANKKRNIESLRLTLNILRENDDYNRIVTAHKDRVKLAKLEIIAQQVLEARETNVIDAELFEEYALHVGYDNTPEEDKTQYLIDNNFTGLENLGVYNSRPDGYGHTCGTCTNIDFRSRTVTVIGFSSDD
jgi:hypothetical protein